MVGFDPVSRAWASTSAAPRNLVGVPPLDGQLLTDPSDLAAAADDFGHIVHQTPQAVLKPGSVNDVVVMLAYCSHHTIPVAARGEGHQTYGQAQVANGLVIDMSPLNSIQISGRSAVVQAGATWADLLNASLAQGLTPQVFTDYIHLSMGGTLSAGGIGGASHHFGAQVDTVTQLTVATAAGNLVTCSATSHSDLFEAVLSGLGQYGVIISATVPLVTAPQNVRQYTLTYPTVDAMTADQRTVVGDGRFNWLEGAASSTGSNPGDWAFELEGAAYFDSTPPDDNALIGDLNYEPGSAQIEDMSYADFIAVLDPAVAFLQSTGEWFDPHPWINLFIPDSKTDAFVTSVMDNLSAQDIGASGVLLLYPVPTAKFTRPMLRVPNEELAFLFAVLRTASPDSDALPVDQLVTANRQLYLQARGQGATRYAIDTVPMQTSDWVMQYGSQWPVAQGVKNKYDPEHVLSPGQGIFSPPQNP